MGKKISKKKVKKLLKVQRKYYEHIIEGMRPHRKYDFSDAILKKMTGK